MKLQDYLKKHSDWYLKRIRHINTSELGLTDLTGIEKLTGLQILTIDSPINHVINLSNNKQLHQVTIRDNKGIKLDNLDKSKIKFLIIE